MDQGQAGGTPTPEYGRAIMTLARMRARRGGKKSKLTAHTLPEPTCLLRRRTNKRGVHPFFSAEAGVAASKAASPTATCSAEICASLSLVRCKRLRSAESGKTCGA